MLRDGIGRCIDYIRISVTDRCNLRCRYCMPGQGVTPITHNDILRYEEILAFMKVAAPAGIRKVRITGGEPLARLGLVSLLRGLTAIPEIEDLALTTNGTLLAAQAEDLRAAGLRRVNLGLPSLDRETYAWLTRGGSLDAALAGLEASIRTGFDPVKINVVLLRDINDDPAPYLELTRRMNVEVRFIEYMAVGGTFLPERFVPVSELRGRLDALGPFEAAPPSPGSGPIRSGFRLPGAPGRLALIAPVSESFCDRCNRVRLTADGRLRLCLLSGRELDLKPALRPQPDPDRLLVLLGEALAVKPAGVPHTPDAMGRCMAQIGG